jgi:hypothetical protein
MAVNRIYAATGLIGGAVGNLDTIDGADLADKDMAIVIDQTTVYFYAMDADSAAAESSPDVISPDDNAGDKRWILQSIRANDLTLSDDIILVADDLTVGGEVVAQGGVLKVGVSDTTRGQLDIYGDNDVGGALLYLYNGANADANEDYWLVNADSSGRLMIGNAGNADILYIDDDTDYVYITTALLANDNVTINMGAGVDFQMFHDGTHNYFRSNNGNLVFQTVATENSCVMAPNGAVDLYNDNVKVISSYYSAGSNQSGVKVYGPSGSNTGVMAMDDDGPHLYLSNFTADSHIILNGVKTGPTYPIFIDCDPAGSVTMYYDGGIAMSTQTNGIKLHDNPSVIQNSVGENAIRFDSNGATSLYYDSIIKVATASTGMDVTGILECDGILLGDTHKIEWDSIPASDATMSGDISSETVDANASGIGALLVLSSDGNWDEADASSSATVGQLGIAVESGTGAKDVLWRGWVKDTAWSWTPGQQLFVSETTGAITATAPSTSGAIVQVVGYATSATTMYFNPSPDYIEVV